MISARTTWLALMPLIVVACNPIRSTSLQPEFDPLPRLDTLINLDKPDLTLIAINGRGPDNRPIRISRGSSPGLTGYTYDQQGRLLARYDPTVFGWNDYELGQYEGQRLAQVYKGATFYPTEPIEYAATVRAMAIISNNRSTIPCIISTPVRPPVIDSLGLSSTAITLQARFKRVC